MSFVFSVAKANLNTEITETLRARGVEALEAQRALRTWFRLRPLARALSSRNNSKPPRLR
jgi:hypothetical protein